MTVTAAISGQSIGTSSNVGSGLFPQKVTRQVTTTAFHIAARVTNGTGGYDPHAEVRVWFSSTSFNITAAAAVSQLKSTARYLDVRPLAETAGVVIRDSSFEPITGSYIHLWVDVPTVSVAQTLDVNVVELP
jgi:hypothetical protein